MPNPSSEAWLIDYAWRAATAGPFNAQDASGTGAAMSIGTFVTANGPGGGSMGPVMSLSTGTTTTGRCAWSMGSGAITLVLDPDLASVYYRALVRVPTLSDGTETFDCYVGCGDTITGATQTDGFGFVYNHDGLGTTWFVQNRAAGVGAAVDSTVTVTAGQVYELVAQWNAAGANVRYWIDGTLRNTVSTNVPGAGQAFGVLAAIIKSAGTTARTLEVAYQEIKVTWATARGLALPTF